MIRPHGQSQNHHHRPPARRPRDRRSAPALEERYLSYALSTITQRALPDVRDGLKPVHRRILHAMRLLRLDPGQGYKKSARVVGDVIGKFHPHGDQSIYDALVRLAQDFALRYPLVDGQGNFGNIDGDSAAAMRYTESRMTDVAARLLEGMAENAIDFQPTYDGEDEEPIVLPVELPQPPRQRLDRHRRRHGDLDPAAQRRRALRRGAPPDQRQSQGQRRRSDPVRPRPRFPDRRHPGRAARIIVNAYETGRGSFRLRAKWEREDKGRGVYQIVVTEIPYGVQKDKLVEKIAELLLAKKLPLLKDVRDESADDIRLVLEPRAGTVEPAILMEQLFRISDLEVRFPLNLNVLDKGTVPKVMSLAEALKAWLEHRKDVLVRRTQHRLDQIARRLEVLDGYLVAYLNLDEVIRIIREEDDSKAILMSTLQAHRRQAEAILNMRLRSLRKLEEIELRSEHKDADRGAGRSSQALLGSDKRQWGQITKQVEALKADYGPDTDIGRRRTDARRSARCRRARGGDRAPSSSASRSPSSSPRRAGSARSRATPTTSTRRASRPATG